MSLFFVVYICSYEDLRNQSGLEHFFLYAVGLYYMFDIISLSSPLVISHLLLFLLLFLLPSLPDSLSIVVFV